MKSHSDAPEEKPEWAVRVLAAIEAASKSDELTSVETTESLDKAESHKLQNRATEPSQPKPPLGKEETEEPRVSAVEEAQILVDREAVQARLDYERERNSLLSDLREAQEVTPKVRWRPLDGGAAPGA